MRSILDLFSKTWFVNIILAVLVVFSGAKSIGVWSGEGGDAEQTIPAPTRTKIPDISKVTRGVLPPESTYEAVAVKDLFTSDRAEPVEEEVKGEEKKPVEETPVVEKDLRVSGKKIVLYGVVMNEDYRTALISNPSNPKPDSPNRPFLWIQEGQNVGDSDIVVSTIKKESIILKKGSEIFEISLYEQKQGREQAVRGKQQQPEEKPTVVTTQPEKSSPSPAKAKAEGRDAKSPEGEDYKIVKTPFGNIKRRVK